MLAPSIPPTGLSKRNSCRAICRKNQTDRLTNTTAVVAAANETCSHLPRELRASTVQHCCSSVTRGTHKQATLRLTAKKLADIGAAQRYCGRSDRLTPLSAVRFALLSHQDQQPSPSLAQRAPYDTMVHRFQVASAAIKLLNRWGYDRRNLHGGQQ